MAHSLILIVMTSLVRMRHPGLRMMAGESDSSPPFSKLLEWDGNVADFSVGVAAMEAGEYGEAARIFTGAVTAAPGGLASPLGGKYAIWLSQALQANRQEQEARGLLKRCEQHADADVQRVAAMVKTVWDAPELAPAQVGDLAPQIQRFEPNSWDAAQDMDYTALLSTRNRMRARQAEPEPDKYSVEWFEQQAAAKQQASSEADEQGMSPLLALAALGIVLGSGVLLASAH